MSILAETQFLLNTEDFVRIRAYYELKKRQFLNDPLARGGLFASSSFEVDDVATRILPLNRVDIGKGERAIPVRVKADGNCLYNACSFAIIGKEDLSSVLRALCSMELYLYADYYASHPHFKSLAEEEQNTSLSDLFFLQSLSFDASDQFDKKLSNHSDCVRKEALRNCSIGRWCPFVCIMALSNVLSLPITSLFPYTQDKSAVALCNAAVLPRDNTLRKKPIYLLWSAMAIPTKEKAPLRPNHIVPVLIVRDVVRSKAPLKLHQTKLSFQNDRLIQNEKCHFNQPSSLQRDPTVKCLSSNSTDVASNSDLGVPFDSDIGSVYCSTEKLSDSQKYDFLKKIWRPNDKFTFPHRSIGGVKRRFAYKWLSNFSWLAYSIKLDGAFCIPCVFFGRSTGQNGTKAVRLVKSPFMDWSCATRVFHDHECKSDVHKTALLSMQHFCDVMENKIKPINVIQDSAFDKTVSMNRRKLESIVKTVVLCGRQNIPLRGHRDDSSCYENEDCGNFQALLNFRVESGDKILDEHFKTAKRNATYRSKSIQNDIIGCCADVINDQIIAELKEAKYFSILADEVTDCSTLQQLPLVLRYVDKNREIQERFIKFIHCDSGISGEALKDKLVNCLQNELELDISCCRGQCYDGAANMAGRYSGLAARILQINPLALYTHCASHRLNLCVAAACHIQCVQNMMSNVTKVGNFFNTPKRQILLENMIKKFCPSSSHTKLIDICRTRWVLRIDGLDRFLEMYLPIFESLFVKKADAIGPTQH